VTAGLWTRTGVDSLEPIREVRQHFGLNLLLTPGVFRSFVRVGISFHRSLVLCNSIKQDYTLLPRVSLPQIDELSEEVIIHLP
jgi:hypothetical protein